jgi:hypothetical protein
VGADLGDDRGRINRAPSESLIGGQIIGGGDEKGGGEGVTGTSAFKGGTKIGEGGDLVKIILVVENTGAILAIGDDDDFGTQIFN